MMDQLQLRSGYSSNVRLSLVTADRCVLLSKIGPGYIVFRGEGVDLPACEAEIVMDIDDRRHQWPVTLSCGAVPFDRTAQVELRK